MHSDGHQVAITACVYFVLICIYILVAFCFQLCYHYWSDSIKLKTFECTASNSCVVTSLSSWCWHVSWNAVCLLSYFGFHLIWPLHTCSKQLICLHANQLLLIGLVPTRFHVISTVRMSFSSVCLPLSNVLFFSSCFFHGFKMLTLFCSFD